MNGKIQKAAWPMATTVTLLALVGVAAGVGHFFTEPYNPGFLKYPYLVQIHAGLGAAYLGLGILQFLPRLRAAAPGVHRRMGRVLAVFGLVIGLSAIFIGLVIPFSGLPEQLVIGGFGFYFVFSLFQGYFCIRNGEIALHREWMIRAYSIGLSVATMRLLFIPALMIIGADNDTARTLSIYSFTISFVMHTVAAEWWIHRTRRAASGRVHGPTTSPVTG